MTFAYLIIRDNRVVAVRMDENEARAEARDKSSIYHEDVFVAQTAIVAIFNNGDEL